MCVIALGSCQASEAQQADIGEPRKAVLTDQASDLEKRVAPNPVCEGDLFSTLSGFEHGDPYAVIEAPDMDLVRASLPVEIELTARLAREEIRPPLTKTYCKLGIRTLVIDYDYPVEDDAVSSVTQRTVYGWSADDRGTGWQIEALGTRMNCLRGHDPDTGTCS